MLSTARTDDGTCAAFHHEPDATGMFTLGWCHGPPGLGWLFRQLELTTGDRSWREWLRRAARTDTASGIPERREPGFWDNVARCCGSAGVAEFFLDLHRLEGDPADLAFARLMIDDLAGRAITDESGTRWSNHEFRNAEQPDLPPETGYLQGAPGIGSTLLRLHRHLGGDPWTVRWPHAPAWGWPADRFRCTARRARISSARCPVLQPGQRLLAQRAHLRADDVLKFPPALGKHEPHQPPVARVGLAAQQPGRLHPGGRPGYRRRRQAELAGDLPGVRPSSRHSRRSTNCWPSYTPCRANTPVDACPSACLASRKASSKSRSWSPSLLSPPPSSTAAGWLDVSGMAR